MSDPRPPQAPEVERAFSPNPHLLAAAVLALLPVLALVGVFGLAGASHSVTQGPLEVTVAYPERYRYKMLHPFEITVRNTSEAVVAGVRVGVDTAYVDRFSGVAFTPTPDDVTADAYGFDLGAIGPGGSRVITAELQAERYWLTEGRVVLDWDAGQPLEILLSTFVWP